MLNAFSEFETARHVNDACCETPHHEGTISLRSSATEHAWRNQVAYIIMGFPRLSETFISQEILILESLGARLRLFAMKAGEEDRSHQAVANIRAPLTYLPRMSSLSGTTLLPWLWHNLPAYWKRHWQLMARRPLPYLKTLCAAVGMSWRYRPSKLAPPRKVFIKEFLQAGYIAHDVLQWPEIKHLHGHFCHGATTVTWFASRVTGLPFSFTAHAKDIYQHDQNPGDLLERKLIAARFVTTCTDANRQHLARRYPDCKAVHTIYHGLDTHYFAPTSAIPKDTTPLVLAVGRLVEKKGLAYLVSACQRLRAQHIPFRCLIVGEPGDQSEALRTQITALGLQDVVEIRGPLTHDKLRRLYARASVFVLPCLIAADGDRDGIPNVLAEAMAMALPVVTTAVSGIPELVRAGIDGISVPQRDDVALAQALALVLDDDRLRERLGQAARQRVCSVFDTRSTTVALKQLFERTATLLNDAV